MILNTDNSVANVKKTKRNILNNGQMKDSLLDSSIEHVEEDFKDGEDDLSTQKYGILQDDDRKTNGNDDTSFIATNDESSIESDPFLNNDNLKYSAKKQEENSIADQVLSKFLLYSVIWTFYVRNVSNSIIVLSN